MADEKRNAEKLRTQINRFFVGKEEIVDRILICLLAGGHVLLEDVPGVGKTTLATLLATVTGLKMGRVQFTPDTMPGDVVGVSVYNMKTGEFEYREGAVMCQLLLADEINRTSPKTQSSLLEAMSEKQVTVDGEKHALPTPFMVIATQNPVEFMGTYPLPEAQIDRFMMCLSIGYPDMEQEKKMARLHLDGMTTDRAEPVCTEEDILEMQHEVERVLVKDAILEYAEEIVKRTRQEERFSLGASPRALLALLRAAQAKAYLLGRDFVLPDDIKEMAEPVLLHRFVLTSQARMAGENTRMVLKNILSKVQVPI